VRSVEFIPEAREEFMAEVAFYEAAQQGLGEKFSSSVEKTVSLVVAFPNVGSPSASAQGGLSLKASRFGSFISILGVVA